VGGNTIGCGPTAGIYQGAALLAMFQTNPLHRFALVNTRNPNEFRDTIVRKFDARTFTIGSSLQTFEASRSYFEFGNVDLVFGTCNTPYEVYFPATDLVKQHLVLQNSGRTQFGGTQFEISPTETAVIPAGAEMLHQYGANFEQFIFRVKPSALQAKLSAVVGMPIARNIEFVTPSHFANPSLQRLKRMLEFMAHELERDDNNVPPAAIAEFEQLLIVSFLLGNQHNFSDLMMREQPRPAPWQVRLVEEYIDANWNRPITVEALAAAAGASTRSVFKAFRESRECSPMAFVKSIRLGHAHRMLQQPNPTTTVVSVAYACGFLNPGHFARDYRLAFGELPSITLASSRRRRH
jgi:AraC-like DNA-binding protein